MGSAAAVELEGLRAGYGREPVLEIGAAEIPRARLTAVVGPNGSGKSTLLGALAGTVRCSGSVRAAYRGRPAFVPQHSAVSDALPCTAGEAVAMGRWAERGPWRRLTAADRAAVAEVLERLDIAHLAKRRIGALSGGQRQRVLVAQGLVQRAELLLLDEPGAGVDAEAQRLIAEAVRAEVDRGAAVVQVSHDLADARGADHCLLLDRGRVHGSGAPRQVLTEDRVARVWRVR